MAYTTDDLVASVRRRGQLPAASADGKLTDADILALAFEEIETLIYPLVTSAREEYWVVASSTSIVANQENYRIPARATAAGLRDVLFQDSGGARYSLPYIDLAESWQWRSNSSTFWPQGMAFTLSDSEVVLLPTPTSAVGKVFFFFTRQHSRLVAVSACAKVTGISGAIYTCDTVPATWSTSTPVDLLQAGPNFAALADDETPDSVTTGAAGNVTLGSAVTDVAVGDYVALAGETCVIQILRELHPLLVSATLVRVLESIGDREGLAVAQTAARATAGQSARPHRPARRRRRPSHREQHEPLARAPQPRGLLMPSEVTLRPRGLMTDPGQVAAAPDGAMVEAKNVQIRRDGLVEPRPGFEVQNWKNQILTHDVKAVIPFDGEVFVAAEDATNWQFRNVDQGQEVTDESAASVQFTVGRIRHAEAAKNLYVTTDDGVVRIADNLDTTAYRSGMPRGLEGHIDDTTTGNVWLADNYAVAYRIVFVREVSGARLFRRSLGAHHSPQLRAGRYGEPRPDHPPGG